MKQIMIIVMRNKVYILYIYKKNIIIKNLNKIKN